MNAVPRRAAEVLRDLCETADRIFEKPYVAFGERDHLQRLRTEISAAIARPVEDERVIGDFEDLLMQTLQRICDDHKTIPRRVPLGRHLLYVVRLDMQRAYELELRPTS